VPFGEPLALELKSFIQSIREDKPAPVSGEDSLKALEVALKCLEQK
jgi:predicted dehydrogenase